MSEGFVYVLTNEVMPGIVKIGFTEVSVEQRLKQLNNTSLPVPFEEFFAARVPDCRSLERTLHFVFGEQRVAVNREFFRINPDLAKAIIQLVAIQELPTVAIALPETMLEDIADSKRRRTERLTFDKLGLTGGTVLTFSKDPEVTCTVKTPRTVMFEGQELSPSSAALKAIHAMGYTWPTVNGFDYWTYQGVKLSAANAVLAPTRFDEGE
jgi:hypothetical protein